MPMCRICNERHYPQSWDGPAEPCICGRGIYGESPYSYAGLSGVWAWFKYSVLRKAFDRVSSRCADWLYREWDY